MSEIKVNKISQRSGTAITLGNSGTDFQLPSGADIVAQSGSTITIAAGATITNSGTATGFGQTYNGAVNWDTTPKTTTVTAASGVGYFINTTSAGVTVNLPAGTAGSAVALADYAATWNTNSVTVNANGTDKIGGVASAPATLNTQGQSVTFIYVDSTEGWINVGDATAVAGNTFISATGGTILTCGDFKTHVFTGPGTFQVTNSGTPAGSNTVEYLVVAGGGGGGARHAGGGGAGGYRQNYPSPAVAGLPVTVTSYPISVGAGSAGGVGPYSAPIAPRVATRGGSSIFSTITSAGGGGGNNYGTPSGCNPFIPGGSGGGASLSGPNGTGNTPPVSPPQGNPGGTVGALGGAGGGGASAAGTPSGSPAGSPGGDGSPLATTFFGPTAPSYGTSGPAPGRYFSGGGGGGGYSGAGSGSGGAGGGGAGVTNNCTATSGTVNTGGGGGGNGGSVPGCGIGGAGGSGIVLIRYKFQ